MMQSLSFAAPWAGALALLGVPAILAIHFLQRPARPEVVSTLFLLERLEPESAGGGRWDRLRSSLPLWLQLLAVLLLAWMLAAPRWLRADAVQSVVVVLDSSASMMAYEAATRRELPARLRELARGAGRTEWIVLESHPAAGRLYTGTRLEELETALAKWQPRRGLHDAGPVLQLAQSVGQGRGVTLFVTDREPVSLPPGTEWLSFAEPVENAGFSGVRADADGWEALLVHYGSAPQTRRWWVEDAAGQRLAGGGEVALAPGRAETLRGRFPEGGAGVRLVLDPPDAFPLDDVLPLVRPEPKRLRVQIAPAAAEAAWFAHFLENSPALSPVTTGGDLAVAVYDPLRPGLPGGPALIWVRHPAPSEKLLPGTPLAERDPLLHGLSWEGLLAGNTFPLPAQPGDRPLLWQGERVLLSRRGPQLLLGFDPALSNAPRLPSFFLLLHRFVEETRAALPGFEAANVETGQPLSVASSGGPLTRTPAPLHPGPVRAPEEPGFFTVQEGDTERLRGAAHFADPREADFRPAKAHDPTAALARRQRERNSRPDGLTPLWTLLLGAALCASWAAAERRRSP